MRRALFVIPHYYAPGNGVYGSTGGDAAPRIFSLESVIAGLHQSLGSRQAFLLRLQQHVPGQGNGHLIRANEAFSCEIDIAVCTVGDNHLLGKLNLPPGLITHVPVQESNPMMLGFAAHGILRDRLGSHDWYCYLEDDLLISDPMFITKLEWFLKLHGEETTLSPHRFERSRVHPVHKLYHDGSVRPDFTSAWQDVSDRPFLETEFPGGRIRFERWPNPHSGCFFLNARQMERWAAQAHFGDRDCSFAGPLESAASLGIIKTFRQYKPSPVNAGFFELEHLHPRYLGESLRFS